MIDKSVRPAVVFFIVAIGFFAMAAIKTYALYASAPKGKLRTLSGEVALIREAKNIRLAVISKSGIAQCGESLCRYQNMAADAGKQAKALVDESGKLHELIVEGKIRISRSLANDRGISLIVIYITLGLIFISPFCYMNFGRK